jgi:hypothetical protein
VAAGEALDRFRTHWAEHPDQVLIRVAADPEPADVGAAFHYLQWSIADLRRSF